MVVVFAGSSTASAFVTVSDFRPKENVKEVSNKSCSDWLNM